jgi:hypothetical protein
MTQPLDAEAVRRDDELLDALAFGELTDGYEADEAAQLLLGWRDDIVHSPMVVPPRLVPPVRRQFGLSRRMSVAAAVGVIAAGSIGSVAAASVAEPGSPLWPITRVVYADRAHSLEARDSALSNLKKAKQAAAKRKPAEAKKLLAEALKQVELVRPGDNSKELKDQVVALQQVLAAIDSPSGGPAPSSGPATAASPSPVESPAPVPTPSDPAPVPTTEPSPFVTPSPADTPAPTQPEQPSPPADPGVGLSSVPSAES